MRGADKALAGANKGYKKPPKRWLFYIGALWAKCRYATAYGDSRTRARHHLSSERLSVVLCRLITLI